MVVTLKAANASVERNFVPSEKRMHKCYLNNLGYP